MKRDSDTAPDERSEKRSKASVNFNGSSFNSSSASLSPATSTSSRIVDATQLSFAARVAKSAPELLPLVIGQEYYKCSNANSPDAFECEHCGGLQHLMWASGPSGRKLLCKTCANVGRYVQSTAYLCF